MIAPLLRPYSGAKLLVRTRNSSVESGFCAVTPPRLPGTSASLLSVPSSKKVVVTLATAVDGDAAHAVRLRDAGTQQDELIGIAENQRQFGHLGVFDHVAQRRVLGVDRGGCIGRDFDSGRDRAGFELRVEGDGLVDRERNGSKIDGLEAGLRNRNRVVARGQASEMVRAGAGSDRGASVVGREIGGGNVRVSDDCACGVSDRTGYRAGLREYRRRSDEKQSESEAKEFGAQALEDVHERSPVKNSRVARSYGNFNMAPGCILQASAPAGARVTGTNALKCF